MWYNYNREELYKSCSQIFKPHDYVSNIVKDCKVYMYNTEIPGP